MINWNFRSSRPDKVVKAIDNRPDNHNTVGSFHSVVVWIECNWLHGSWGAVKAFIPDHIASQYRWFISFCCCLDRMQSCTSSTNLTICPIFGTYCTIGTNVTNQREVCMDVLGVYTVLGETTRNPTYTMVKPLDSNVIIIVPIDSHCNLPQNKTHSYASKLFSGPQHIQQTRERRVLVQQKGC